MKVETLHIVYIYSLFFFCFVLFCFFSIKRHTTNCMVYLHFVLSVFTKSNQGPETSLQTVIKCSALINPPTWSREGIIGMAFVCPFVCPSICHSVTLTCLLHISWTLWKIFINLWSNVCLSEMMCRIHYSTIPTQGQGHNWRSRVWA